MAIATALLLALLVPAAGQAARKKGEAVFEGTVMNQAGEGLAGVTITVTDGEEVHATTTSDKRGRFKLELAAGELVLEMEREGYAPFAQAVQLEPGQRLSVEVNLLDAEAGRRNEAIVAYNEGAKAYGAGDRATAKTRFQAAIEADPSLAEPYRPLADLYLEEGSHAEAAATAERYLALRPGERDVQLVAYEAYRKLGDRTKIDPLRGLLAEDPKLAPKLAVHAFNEGALADQAGDETTALARFQEALALDSGLAAAHFALASVHYRRQRFDEALAALETGLGLQPANVDGRRLRYAAHDALGDEAAAAAALEAYIEVAPGAAADLLYESAELSFKAGELDRARRELTRLLELEPDRARAHYTLGLVYVSSDAALAKSHLRRFLELAPDDPERETAEQILEGLD